MGNIGGLPLDPAPQELFETTECKFGEYWGLCHISAYSGLLGAGLENYNATREIFKHEHTPLVDATRDYLPKDTR